MNEGFGFEFALPIPDGLREGLAAAKRQQALAEALAPKWAVSTHGGADTMLAEGPITEQAIQVIAAYAGAAFKAISEVFAHGEDGDPNPRLSDAARAEFAKIESLASLLMHASAAAIDGDGSDAFDLALQVDHSLAERFKTQDQPAPIRMRRTLGTVALVAQMVEVLRDGEALAEQWSEHYGKTESIDDVLSGLTFPPAECERCGKPIVKDEFDDEERAEIPNNVAVTLCAPCYRRVRRNAALDSNGGE